MTPVTVTVRRVQYGGPGCREKNQRNSAGDRVSHEDFPAIRYLLYKPMLYILFLSLPSITSRSTQLHNAVSIRQLRHSIPKALSNARRRMYLARILRHLRTTALARLHALDDQVVCSISRAWLASSEASHLSFAIQSMIQLQHSATTSSELHAHVSTIHDSSIDTSLAGKKPLVVVLDGDVPTRSIHATTKGPFVTSRIGLVTISLSLTSPRVLRNHWEMNTLDRARLRR